MKPVCQVKADKLTEATATSILRNNVAGKALCGGKWAACPKPSAPAPATVAAPPAAKPAREKAVSLLDLSGPDGVSPDDLDEDIWLEPPPGFRDWRDGLTVRPVPEVDIELYRARLVAEAP
jgi:hypothetical protein